MRVYLVRHGETDWNKARKVQGSVDIPLNAYGIELAEKTAEGLKSIPFDKAFTSPLQRAAKTAEIILVSQGLSAEVDKRLMEMNFGEYEGICTMGIRENPNHPFYPCLKDPERFQPSGGGESIADVYARARDFWQDKILPLEGTCENVLVVAHGGWNRCIINPLLGIPDSRFWDSSFENCSVSIVDIEKGETKLVEASKLYYV